MRFSPEDLTPKENKWFSPTVEYNGTGRADFADDRGAAEGEVRIIFDECGDTKIQMEIERLTGPDPRPKEIMDLVATRRLPKPSGGWDLSLGSRMNLCKRLAVDTGEGVFNAAGRIDYNLPSGADGGRVSLDPWVSEFDSKGPGKAKYWAAPLLNFVSDFCPGPPELSNHPLRIFPTPSIPEGPSKENFPSASLYANSRNQLIVFAFNGSPAFIEPLPDYAEREAKLRSLSAPRLITAVMVGEVGDNSIRLEALKSWFPYDLLRALNFVTGSEVGVPWLEFRDERGGLLRRAHQLHCGACFEEGHRVIEEGIHRGTGRFLTCFLSSWRPGESYLPVAMKHAAQGWCYSRTSTEERLIYVIRGLECLCKRLVPSEPDLKKRLTPEKQRAVKAILDEAGQRINSLAGDPVTPAEQAELSALGEIANRVRTTPWGKSGTFGLALIDLLNHLGLADAIALDAHFAKTATERWASRVSRARGAPTHEGFFDFDSGAFGVDEVFILTRHLHDVLVRTILKIVRYDGVYQPTVVVGTTMQPVDWVRPSTPASDLGYR